MSLWIKNPLAIWTGNEREAQGGLVIAQGRVVELVKAGSRPQTRYQDTFDAKHCVIIPGLVNAHHHFYQTLTRAQPAALNRELFSWLKQLYPIWAKLDDRAIELSTRLAVAELMLSGCTLTNDHHYLFSAQIPSAIDIQIEVLQECKLRAVLTRGSMSLGENQGGLPPESVVQSDEEILLESERLLKKVNALNNAEFVQLALAPCSPFSVTPELMYQSARLARQYSGLLHTHLGETEDENTFCLQKFGKRPLDYLAAVDWLADDVWLAHGIHFNANEIKRLGAAGVGICHCPSSNMILASGICPTRELERAGSPLALGVDGSASNDCSNVMQEVRQAFLLGRLRYGAEQVSHHDALRWATQGGARVFKRADLGEIAPGKQADLAFFDLDELRFSGAGDPVAALVLCGAHRVKHLMVAGEFRVQDGELLGTDLARLMAEHTLLARRLLN